MEFYLIGSSGIGLIREIKYKQKLKPMKTSTYLNLKVKSFSENLRGPSHDTDHVQFYLCISPTISNFTKR